MARTIVPKPLVVCKRRLYAAITGPTTLVQIGDPVMHAKSCSTQAERLRTRDGCEPGWARGGTRCALQRVVDYFRSGIRCGVRCICRPT
ncbi:transposase [Anopheles sinensis]|uniref:Transposase n=1 Tax=Anopheles sinensis TaxID=74873 RepID=A0A084WNN4_ANOSI|nr:transposase [Anopheles sinensis]